jgi:hypothetical protein
MPRKIVQRNNHALMGQMKNVKLEHAGEIQHVIQPLEVVWYSTRTIQSIPDFVELDGQKQKITAVQLHIVQADVLMSAVSENSAIRFCLDAIMWI